MSLPPDGTTTASDLQQAAGGTTRDVMPYDRRSADIEHAVQYIPRRSGARDALLDEAVQTGLNLYLPLKNPAQMDSLLATVQGATADVHTALESLHYVHFARFLPMPDRSALWVITEFDGDLKSYIMDFVAVLGDVFNAILSYTAGAPPLPVQKYPEEFFAFVDSHNLKQAQPWSAYKNKTVLEINGTRAVVGPRPEPGVHIEPPVIDLADVQGNVLRGYPKMDRAHYVALRIPANGMQAARGFLSDLLPGADAKRVQVTTGATHGVEPPYCLNISFTSDGLAALGVDAATMGAFPEAFRQGAAARADKLFDEDDSRPDCWTLGGPSNPAHILLSMYGREEVPYWMAALRAVAGKHRLEEVWNRDAQMLDGAAVHFGYRDGIAQPRVEGMPRRKTSDMQPPSRAGEFLLGRDYVNQFGGNFISKLPGVLADNGSYASFAVLEQDCAAFEASLQKAAGRYGLDPELVAAKMMGRWRNGTPLSVSPNSMHSGLPESQINNFDYAPTPYHPTVYDDYEGMRCPVGAHARRMNPRGAVVTGKPHSRRVIRRALPYGPPFDPKNPNDGIERGLVGSFICGDLEMQFEFMQGAWANQDIATAGLKDTRDPLIGTQPEGGGKFVIRTDDSRDPIVLHLPTFVKTKGRLYAFMPGIGGLRYLSSLTT